MLTDKLSQDAAFELLTSTDFYAGEHVTIFSAMQELNKVGEPITSRTLTTELRKNNLLEQVGGAYAILALNADVVQTHDTRKNCLSIKELSIKRQVIIAGNLLGQKGYLDHVDAFTTLQEFRTSLENIEQGLPSKKELSIKEAITVFINEAQKREANQTGITGIPSGFPKLDRITKGWQKSDLVIIAARPGMGKTAFVLSLLRNAAVDHNIPVAMFSIEMGSKQITERLISAEIEMELSEVRSKQLTDLEWTYFNNKIGRLFNAPIFIDDTPAISITEVRIKCARLKADHGVQLIVIDYLQLMSGEGEGNREQEIANISRSLKGIAKSLDIPIIALAQLSRTVETRGGDKRPVLSDLRESGSIEQDADMVIFITRPEYYKITADEKGELIPGATDITIAKYRNGATGGTYVKFIGKYTTFRHVDSGYVKDQYIEATPAVIQPDLWNQSRAPEPTANPNNDDLPF